MKSDEPETETNTVQEQSQVAHDSCLHSRHAEGCRDPIQRWCPKFALFMSPFAWSRRSHAQKLLLSDNISEWSGNRREAAEQYCKNRVLEAVDGTASLPSLQVYYFLSTWESAQRPACTL